MPQIEALGPTHIAPDKLAHFIAFGVLAVLCERSRLAPRWVVMLAVTVWVPLDEWTQSVFATSRQTSLDDVLSGWLGVLTAAVVTTLLGPPHGVPATSHWARAFTSLDAVAARGGGGVMIALIVMVVSLASTVGFYLFIWFTAGTSQGSVALLLGGIFGLIVAWPFTRRAWRRVGGPPWPLPGPAMWLYALCAGGIGFAMAMIVGMPTLRMPMMLCGFSIMTGVMMRSEWQQHEVPSHG